MALYTPEEVEAMADSCRTDNDRYAKDREAMLRAYAAILRQPAARVGEDARDRVAKAIADVIGHGMREKCYPHADAALEAALSAQPAPERQGVAKPVAYAQIENGQCVGLAFKAAPNADCVTPLYTHPAAPVGVPDAMRERTDMDGYSNGYVEGWNACRDSALAAAPSAPQGTQQGVG